MRYAAAFGRQTVRPGIKREMCKHVWFDDRCARRVSANFSVNSGNVGKRGFAISSCGKVTALLWSHGL